MRGADAVIGRLPVLHQLERTECALVCLVMTAQAHGVNCSLQAARQRWAVDCHGWSLRRILEVADALGLRGRGVALEPAELRQLPRGAILHWDGDHFVVLQSAGRGGIVVHDPAVGRRRHRWSAVARHSTGIAIVLEPRSDTARLAQDAPTADAPADAPPAVLRWALSLPGVRSGLFGIAAAALAAQCLALIAPFHVQLMIDQGLGVGSSDLLLVLSLAFAGALLLREGFHWLQGELAARLALRMQRRLTGQVFETVLGQSLRWHRLRTPGDVLSRLGALGPVVQLVCAGLAGLVFDALFAIGALTLLLLHAPILAFTSGVLLLVLIALQASFLPLHRRRERLSLESAARLETTTLALLRTVEGLRSQRLGTLARGRWDNHQVVALHRGFVSDRLARTGTSLEAVALGLEGVLAVQLGTHQVLEGTLSLGMLYAVIHFKLQLVDRGRGLLGGIAGLRLLGLHARRLGGLLEGDRSSVTYPGPDAPSASSATTDPAPEWPAVRQRSDRVPMAVRVTDLTVRFGGGPARLSNLSLDVRAGAFWLVSGASGCGKSTLLRTIAGLETAAAGRVELDGWPYPDAAARSGTVPDGIAIVRQHDHFHEGRLLDNLVGFDDTVDERRLTTLLRSVDLWEDVCALPMGLLTPVDDGRAALSGGQWQRLFLVRAIYSQPRLLLLDEPVAHLDAGLAERVWRLLESLDCTRIVVSHSWTAVRFDHRLQLDAC